MNVAPKMSKGMWVVGWCCIGFMAHGGLNALEQGEWFWVAWSFLPMPFIGRYWWKLV